MSSGVSPPYALRIVDTKSLAFCLPSLKSQFHVFLSLLPTCASGMEPFHDYQDYTVGWICAVEVEYVVACEMLDNEHKLLPNKAHDVNAYTLGDIGDHNIAIACLPKGQYGTVSAAAVAVNMLNTFEAIRIGLMVGIGGGAPSAKHDVRLGDVVVATPSASEKLGGVMPYDYGKLIQEKKFGFMGHLNAAPTFLLTALTRLSRQQSRTGNEIAEMIPNMIAGNRWLKKRCERPEEDRLYEATYIHPSDQPCRAGCNRSALRLRDPRDPMEEDVSTVHFGTIASADKLMKDANIRDNLAAEYDVLCFEMEAAGLMNNFPCLVIRGICDYSDTHKNDVWQGYAAAAAAVYAKQLLESIPAADVERRDKAADVMEKLENLSVFAPLMLRLHLCRGFLARSKEYHLVLGD